MAKVNHSFTLTNSQGEAVAHFDHAAVKASNSVIDKIKAGYFTQQKKTAALEELLNSLSKKQQNAARGVLDDLINTDLAWLANYKKDYDPNAEELEAAVGLTISDTGAAIQAAFLGQERPKRRGNAISSANYRRLRLMFDKWPKKRHALYIYLIVGHETRLRWNSKADRIEAWADISKVAEEHNEKLAALAQQVGAVAASVIAAGTWTSAAIDQQVQRASQEEAEIMRAAHAAGITPEEAGNVLKQYDQGLTARQAVDLIEKTKQLKRG